MAQLSLAMPQPVKHAKPVHPSQEPVLTGWATRLYIPGHTELEAPGNVENALMLQDESNASLFFAKYSLHKAWQWLFQQGGPMHRFGPEHGHRIEPTAWKDSAPR